MKTSDIREPINALRALVRHQTHGGYTWAATLDDGETICVQCARQEYRQVFRSTRDKTRDGWQVEGLTHSGETDEATFCVHCGRLIWESQS
jgi:hypothetical protein